MVALLAAPEIDKISARHAERSDAAGRAALQDLGRGFGPSPVRELDYM
jgi:hypothetical protein